MIKSDYAYVLPVWKANRLSPTPLPELRKVLDVYNISFRHFLQGNWSAEPIYFQIISKTKVTFKYPSEPVKDR